MTEATQTGAAELNSPAPTSVAAAAEKLNGLFSAEPETKKKPVTASDVPPEGEPEGEPEVQPEGDEPEGDAGEDAPADDAHEDGDEGQSEQPLTTLKDIAEKLGVEESKLFDLKLPTKIDGVEGEATLAQLVKSFQLEGHLNRELMKVADQRKEVEKAKESIEQERNAKLGELGQLAQIAQHLLYGEWQQVKWDQLRAEDPNEYLLKKNQFEEYNQALGQINAAIQAKQSEAAQVQQEAFKKHVAEQQKKLIEAVPEWSNKETLKKEYGELVAFLREAPDLRISDDELNRMTDHRFYLMARDAKRYRDLQKTNPRVQNKANTPPAVVKSGNTGPAHKDALKTQELRKKLRTQKDVSSAAALLNQVLKPR